MEATAIPTIEGIQIYPEQGRLMISFAYDPHNVARIRRVDGRRWHAEEKCWSIPRTERAVEQLRALFSSSRPPELSSRPRAVPEPSVKGARTSQEEELFLEPTRQELRLRGYSRHTRKSYCHHFLRFRRHVQRDPGQVDQVEVRQYLLHLIEEEGVSRAYLNQAISAIKFSLQSRVEDTLDSRRLAAATTGKKVADRLESG